MHDLVLRIKEPALCYVFADNAIRRGHEALALEAYRRAVDLRAEAHANVTDDERLALKSFYAYEEALSHGQRKRKRATGTWQMVAKQGILPTLCKRLASKSADEALDKLRELNMEDYSFRAVAAQIGLDLEQAA